MVSVHCRAALLPLQVAPASALAELPPYLFSRLPPQATAPLSADSAVTLSTDPQVIPCPVGGFFPTIVQLWNPCFFPLCIQITRAVLQLVKDPDVRRRTLVAMHNDDVINIPVLAALVDKRHELAAATGYKSFPQYAAKTRIVTEPSVRWQSPFSLLMSRFRVLWLYISTMFRRPPPFPPLRSLTSLPSLPPLSHVLGCHGFSVGNCP